MIQLQSVKKQYESIAALQNITLTVNKGDIYGIIGTSGSGKSTLLRLMNLLEVPTEGAIFVNNQELTALKPKALREARKSIGMIFQHFNLVANYNVYKNVEIGLELANISKKERKQRVNECLQFVGLEKYINSYPANLSGGQKQRVAIARALATNPSVLLCDEPTSALDPSTTEEILNVLNNINQQLGVTIVIVSHEMSVIKSICNRVTVLDQGRIYETIEIEPTGVIHKGSSAQRFIDALKSGEQL